VKFTREGYPAVPLRMSLLTLTTSHEQEAVRVSLAGELDLSSALTFDEELRRIENEEPGTLVLDLNDLKFMDSTGLRLIISANARATRDGRRFAIANASKAINRILRLTGMHDRLDVLEDRAEARVRT
jgi:anti-sigma B factor antagonist